MRFFPLLFSLIPFLLPALSDAKAIADVHPATAEINPGIELLSGVLTQTRWMNRRGPVKAGNPYFRELKALFAPQAQHRAVRLADALVSHGFTYDAHPDFALCLGPLPGLELIRPYPPDLLSRFGGQAEGLEEFRRALRDLAHEVQFEQFLERHAADYQRWCAGTEFNRERTVTWLEQFFGTRENEFHLILAPAMFPLGGYGPSFREKNGRTVVCQIVRADARRDDSPNFPAKLELEALALHEWGHAFVNPALANVADRVKNMRPHFDAVADAMKAQAYPSVAVYANEQVLRACVIVAVRQTQGAEAAEKQIRMEEKRGFLLTRAAVRALDDYAAHRDKYPTFAEFAPELLDRLAKEPVTRGAAPR